MAFKSVQPLGPRRVKDENENGKAEEKGNLGMEGARGGDQQKKNTTRPRKKALTER